MLNYLPIVDLVDLCGPFYTPLPIYIFNFNLEKTVVQGLHRSTRSTFYSISLVKSTILIETRRFSMLSPQNIKKSKDFKIITTNNIKYNIIQSLKAGQTSNFLNNNVKNEWLRSETCQKMASVYQYSIIRARYHTNISQKNFGRFTL